MEGAFEFRADILYWRDNFSRRLCSSCVKKVPETIPNMMPKIMSHVVHDLSSNHLITCDRCYLSLVKVSANFKGKELMSLDLFLKMKKYVEDVDEYFKEKA